MVDDGVGIVSDGLFGKTHEVVALRCQPSRANSVALDRHRQGVIIAIHLDDQAATMVSKISDIGTNGNLTAPMVLQFSQSRPKGLFR